MDAPSVQYLITSDGLSTAYTITGSGMPFVFMPPIVASHVLLSRDLPSAGSWLEALTQSFKVIHYDSRGQGLSTRGLPADFAMRDYELDLEAVVDCLGLKRFVLFGTGYFGHVAIRFAARNADRIHALILLNTSISMTAWPMTMYRDVARENWELFLRNVSPATTWDAAEREAAVGLFREMITQADHLIAAEAFAQSDVGDLLPGLKVPTLVLAGTNFSHLRSVESTRLAAATPGAHLKLISGSPLFPEVSEGLPAIQSFLSTLGEPLLTGGAATPPGSSLSAREVEVLRLVASGQTNQQIADALVISRNTVRRHVSNVFDKTGIVNRAQAGAWAREHGLA